MSDSVTPPRPTAATAAELREATIQMHCDSGGCDSVRGGPPGSHDSVGCHLAGMLDDLMAAVRADALRDADAAVEELETRARSQKRSGKTVADRSAGHSAEYALACARTAICAMVSK